MTGILGALLGSFKKLFSWSVQSITNQVYTSALYANLSGGKYFAFGLGATGAATQAYQYSTDGITWSSGTIPTSSSLWVASATNGSRIVVARSNNTLGAYYSDNGTTWTASAAFPTSFVPKQMLWDGTRFIVTGAVNSHYYSTTGETWSTSTGGGSQGVGFDGTSRYVSTRAVSTTIAVTTTSFPTNWVTITMPTSGIWVSPVYGNGIWVVGRLGGSGTYATSSNGTTWTSRTMPSGLSEATSDIYTKIVFANGNFYYYYLDTLYSSADGINWVTVVSIPAGTLDVANGWAINGPTMLVFGQDSTTLGSNAYLIGK